MYSPSSDEKVTQAQVQDRPLRIRKALRVEAECAKDDDSSDGDNNSSGEDPRVEEPPLVVSQKWRLTGTRAARYSSGRPLKQNKLFINDDRSGNKSSFGSVWKSFCSAKQTKLSLSKVLFLL
jgi:hypothetical protein